MYNFKEKIIFNTNVEQYEEALIKLDVGNINITEVRDWIFSKIRN